MVTVAPIMESLAACRTMLQSARTRVSASSTGGDSVEECRKAVDECKHRVDTLRQRCHATSELLDKATAAQALAQVRSCAPCRHNTASANVVVHTHTHSASWRQSVMTLHALAPWCLWWALAAIRLLLRPWTTRIKLFVVLLRCEQQLLAPPCSADSSHRRPPCRRCRWSPTWETLHMNCASHPQMSSCGMRCTWQLLRRRRLLTLHSQSAIAHWRWQLHNDGHYRSCR